jgi:hypothetical protein
MGRFGPAVGNVECVKAPSFFTFYRLLFSIMVVICAPHAFPTTVIDGFCFILFVQLPSFYVDWQKTPCMAHAFPVPLFAPCPELVRDNRSLHRTYRYTSKKLPSQTSYLHVCLAKCIEHGPFRHEVTANGQAWHPQGLIS